MLCYFHLIKDGYVLNVRTGHIAETRNSESTKRRDSRGIHPSIPKSIGNQDTDEASTIDILTITRAILL